MRKNNYIFTFILLGVVVLFSLGKTLQYYFYTDDFAFIYHLQNNSEFGWPYSSVLTLFRPVYKLFNTNALPYFSLAVFTYFLASIGVYFFVKTLTGNKLIAFLSSLIFATGYIGIDQFSMIAVSIINNLNIVNVSITLISLIYWVNTKKLRYYCLTFFMFWFSVRLFPYRAYPLILFLPTLELVKSLRFGHVTKIAKQFAFLVIRYIPFVLVASQFGIFSYGTYGTGKASAYISSHSRIFTLLNFEFFKELFAILGRLVLIKPVSDIFGLVPNQSLNALIGLIFFLLISVTSLFLLFGKKSDYARSLLAVLFITIEGYVGNMILNVDFDSDGPVNRYLTIAFMSFSAILPLFLFLLLEKVSQKFKWVNRRLVLVVLIIPVICSFACLSRKYEDFIIEERSKPAKNFYKQLKAYVPKISDYTVFYFDRALYYPIAGRFGNVLLSAAMDKNVNLAMSYKISTESVKIVDTFEDFLLHINNPPPGKKVSYDTFYNDENGLQNTTDKVFTLLKNGSRTTIPEGQIHYQKNRGSSAITIETSNVSSLTPLKVKFSLRASPLDFASFTFPYIGVDTQNELDNASIKDYFQKNNIQKETIFKYLLSRERYYRTVSVDVESIHIAKQNPASYLIDDNPDTAWLSDQSRWEVHIKPWVKIDLGEKRNISRLLWRQLPNRVITEFTLSTSLDGNTWAKVNNIRQSNVFSDKNLVINDFNPIDTRYIMLTINNLASGLNPGPGLSEIGVIESSFRDIDLELALRIKKAPFEYIKDRGELLQTYEYLAENAKLKIKRLTNKDGSTSNTMLQELPVALDGQSHEYEFQLPSGGTELKNIQLEANFPADLLVENVVLENQLKKVLDEQIEKKCQDFAKVEDYANPFDCKWE